MALRLSTAAAAILACLSLLAGGCLQVSTGTGTGSGTGASTADDGGTASGEGGTTGAGLSECGTDPTTGVTLCLQSSACPGITIGSGAFPNCGFRQGGASLLDLECLCNGDSLCPIGVPTSCGVAEQLLTQEQSSLQVCQQVSTGACISLVDAGGGSGTSGLSSECQTCVAGCGGTPACYESCGC